jgi:superfamily II DNA or RNA helicase
MRLGWTATPRRLDGLSLMDLFQERTFEYGILQGIRDGYLAELKGVRVKTNVDLSSAKKSMGDFNVSDLEGLVDIPERNKLIVDSYLKYADGRQFICFGVDTSHTVSIAKEFTERGINVEVHSSYAEITPDRSGIVDRFMKKEIVGLINCNTLTEGFDYSDVGAILDASPTMSESRYLQRVGRGTRIKSQAFQERFGNNCMIIDFVDLSSRHKLVNAFELDKQLPAIDKVFITSEDREKILNAEKKRRESRIVSTVEKDEYFDLASPPKIKISTSDKMMEEATAAQLKLLSWFDLYQKEDEAGNEIEYTKKNVSELLNTTEILPWMKKKMIEWKYNPTGATISQYLAISREVKILAEKKVVEEAQERMKNDLVDSLVNTDFPF